ncbi:hypothetical protein FY534_00120 [Alicyclobacillus sp. TC]|uniref:ATP-binding protein n=1 Tax=Alicyclobacillus sp. TC TaxID=2606450 RepID=UPI0019343CD8|nr:ATP-binding protein [Alicyclobacillus sp. TC]QRF22264.1 hypothetical protein FY534_00120 [Alicyclobacillus sp. TC]
MSQVQSTEHVDITPNPRVLRTLGEIPFEPWQCFAELIDNSIDSFQSATTASVPLSKKQIIISWTSTAAAAGERKIEIRDTGPGMTLDSIRNAVQAGYSSKTSTDSLGMFGMGFNIATARLGEQTVVLSTRTGDPNWVGVLIDFEEMIRNQNYEVPVVRFDKANSSDHGTRIIISKLKPGIFDRIRGTESQIRNTLADVYSPILRSMDDLEILVQMKKCKAVPYCVWSESRYVVRGGETIHAIQKVDENVGIALFDVNKNRYLSIEEEDEAYEFQSENGVFPDGIIEREKRIVGWIGIQRFGDASMFGIDFVRNGRKILRKDKSLFSYWISETGTSNLEYPKELGSTWGGRIVGEIHVDHLVPTYQKNDFDRTDASWYEMVNILRGDGPILKEQRQVLNYQGQNNSPIGKLVRGFQRQDPGTKWLAIKGEIAREWAKKFFLGDLDYMEDTKWFEAAQRADMDKADRGAGRSGRVNPGSSPSDDPDDYGPDSGNTGGSSQREDQGNSTNGEGRSNEGQNTGEPGTGQASNGTAEDQGPDLIEDLLSRSVRDDSLCREYRYRNCPSPLAVEVRRLTSGVIGTGPDGVPLLWDKANFRSLKFFYNPFHPFFMTRRTQPYEMLLLHLADVFITRDRLDRELTAVYIELLEEMFPDERIDLGTIQERSQAFFDRMRGAAIDLLSSRESEILDTLHEHPGDLEVIVQNLIVSNPELQMKVLHREPGGIKALAVAPERFLVTLISRYPEEFFDGNFFRVNYSLINFPSSQATERIREEAKERVISYIKDAQWVLSPSDITQRGGSKKEELLRCSHSLELLEEMMVE